MEQTLFRLLLTTKLKAQRDRCHGQSKTKLKAQPNRCGQSNIGLKTQRDHCLEQSKDGLKAQQDHSPGQRPGNTCKSIINALKEQKQ